MSNTVNENFQKDILDKLIPFTNEKIYVFHYETS